MQQFYPSGARIAGRYEVAGRPLLGGMGIVYLCFDHLKQRPVALKTFKPEYLSDSAARDRFLQEGDAWVRLGTHPHVVRCYGIERIGDGREVYLVLELVAKVEGRRDASLRAWQTSGQSLPADQALLIALQIVRGMRHASQVIPGFVHRDLKPENVLLGADHLSNAPINRVRVTDFGLAKSMRTEQEAKVQNASDRLASPGHLTRVGAVLGTPQYMAPEQWTGADVDVRADIYALGCILGEMFTGHLLVQGGTLEKLQLAHERGQPLVSATAAIPQVLQQLLEGCLAAKLGQRYADWTELETALVTAYARVAGRTAPQPEADSTLSQAERMATGWSYNDIGMSYLDIGQAEKALQFYVRAQQVSRAEGRHQLEGAVLGNLGNAYAALGDARRAVDYHRQTLSIHQELGNRQGEANAMNNLGLAYAALGDAYQAIQCYEQALAIHREISEASLEPSTEWVTGRRGEGQTLNNLGNAYANLGDSQEASSYYTRALAISREINDRRGEGAALNNLGNVYLRLGSAHRAISHYEHALNIAREIGDRVGESQALGNLGLACFDLGDARRAAGYHEQDLAISREVGDRLGESQALGNLGAAYLRLGEARRAVEYSNLRLAISRDIGDRRGEGHALGNLGLAYENLGDIRQAIDCEERALAIHRKIGDRHGLAIGSLNLALLYAQLGDQTKALPLAREAAQIWGQVGHVAYEKQAKQLVAKLEGQGR